MHTADEIPFNLPKFFHDRKFFFLFIFLLMPYLLHPISEAEFWGVSLLDISLSLFLFMGVFAVSGRRRIATTALVLLLASQILTWTTHALSNHVLILVGIALNALFLIYTAVLILIHVLKSRSVTSQTIFAALCVYLMIGLIWAFIYSFLEDLNPGSFKINYTLFPEESYGLHLFSKLYYFMYFSFTTLSTLGFGDIVPASSWSRVAASMEAIVGQLYLVVLVSSLVGLRVTQVFQAEVKEIEREHGKY